MATVMVAGHICLDIAPTFQNEPIEVLSDILAPGKLVQVGPADIHTGGAVSNTGLAMRFFGADVTLLAKIGNDSFGQVIRENLSAHHVSLHLVEDPVAGTSYSVVLAIPGIDRLFLHHPGANNTFVESDIPDALLDGITHFHFGYPPLMRHMFEDGGEGLAKLFKRIKLKGITTSLDMAAVDPASPAGMVDWRAILEKVLPYVDFYLPSIEETCYMMDRNKHRLLCEKANGGDITNVLCIEEDVCPLADELQELGATVVILKCGAPGMYYKTATMVQMAPLCEQRGLNAAEWADKSGFEHSYLPDSIVSGTGAGDTSIAAFLTSMLKGYSLEQCMRFAVATGACCLSAHDALSGLEPFDALQRRMDAGWPKNKIL